MSKLTSLRAAIVATAVAAVALASAGSASAGSCASLSRVKYFKGFVTIGVSGTAKGKNASSGGTRTVRLDDAFTINTKTGKPTIGAALPLALVAGTASSSKANVDESLKDTGEGASGTLTGTGSLFRGGVSIYFETKTCRYVVSGNAASKATYKGDLPSKPAIPVQGSAMSPIKTAPSSLHLAGSAHIDTMDQCKKKTVAGSGTQTVKLPVSCYSGYFGWFGDFAALSACGEQFGSSCTFTETKLADGKASIYWNLKPVF